MNHNLTTTVKTSKPMKPRQLPLILALALLAGCNGIRSASPTTKLILAQNLYAETLNRLSDLRDAGKLDDAAALRCEAARVVAKNFITLGRQKRDAGDKVGADDALLAALKSLAEINALLRQGPQ